MIKIEEFDELQKKLYSAVIADILDDFGVRNNVMYYNIKPIAPNMSVMGRAFTILATDVYQQPEKPYELEIEAVDNTGKGDVIVVTTNKSTSAKQTIDSMKFYLNQ